MPSSSLDFPFCCLVSWSLSKELEHMNSKSSSICGFLQMTWKWAYHGLSPSFPTVVVSDMTRNFGVVKSWIDAWIFWAKVNQVISPLISDRNKSVTHSAPHDSQVRTSLQVPPFKCFSRLCLRMYLQSKWPWDRSGFMAVKGDTPATGQERWTYAFWQPLQTNRLVRPSWCVCWCFVIYDGATLRSWHIRCRHMRVMPWSYNLHHLAIRTFFFFVDIFYMMSQLLTIFKSEEQWGQYWQRWCRCTLPTLPHKFRSPKGLGQLALCYRI